MAVVASLGSASASAIVVSRSLVGAPPASGEGSRLAGCEDQACHVVQCDDVRAACLPVRQSFLAEERPRLKPRDHVPRPVILADHLGRTREDQIEAGGRLALLDNGEAGRIPLHVDVVAGVAQNARLLRQHQQRVHEVVRASEGPVLRD